MAGITGEHEWHGSDSFLNNAVFPREVWATLTTGVQDEPLPSLLLRNTAGYGDTLQTQE